MATQEHWHRRLLEPNAGWFAVLTTLVISVGGLVEIVPMFTVEAGAAEALPPPYTPLEVAGRDIYVREGCMACHSQMIRPFRDETLRYGEWSRAEEYAWDRPFLLGSRRIGPDLHRVGGKYPDAWHWEHMNNPRSTSPGSVMPAYPWLITGKLDPVDVQKSVVALQRVGTPYSATDVSSVNALLHEQGSGIVERLADAGIESSWDDEIVALIAYLQRLGTNGPGAVARAGEGPEPVGSAGTDEASAVADADGEDR